MLISDFFLILFSVFVLLLLATTTANLLSRTPSVPSKKRVIEEILKIASLKPGQKIYDLGCGDARLLYRAEKKYQIQGIGFENAPLVYLLACLRKFLIHSKVKIYFRNFFKANLQEAQVIFCYLTPFILKKLALKIKKECPPGTKIISHTFEIPGLKPQKVIPRNLKTKIPSIYFYQLP